MFDLKISGALTTHGPGKADVSSGRMRLWVDFEVMLRNSNKYTPRFGISLTSNLPSGWL